MDSHARLHAELTGLLRQLCLVCDERHFVLLGWMVTGLRCPKRIDRLLLIVAIAVLISALQAYAVSRAGERRCVDPHWKRWLNFARIGLHSIQQSVIASCRMLLAWMPIQLQALEACIPSRDVRRRQKKPWFSRIELPPLPQPRAAMAIA